MQGTVQEFSKGQSGRTKVKIDGHWYNVGNDCDLDGTTVMIGERIEFDSSSSQFKGRDVWWLNKYAKLPGTPKQNGGMTQQQAPNTFGQMQAPTLLPYVAPVSTTTTVGGSLDEPTLRFISNCVGSAISAKTLVDPCDIEIWVSAARNAIKGQS